MKNHLFPIAQCVLCSVYFSAQPNKLRPILKFKKYYPIKQIITSHNAIYNANCATMPNVHLMFWWNVFFKSDEHYWLYCAAYSALSSCIYGIVHCPSLSFFLIIIFTFIINIIAIIVIFITITIIISNRN